jgi:hypothetical protein
MYDLRKADDFWAALEEVGGSLVALARETGIPRETLKTWKRHHQDGRIWTGRHWERPGVSTKEADIAALIDYLTSRAVPSPPPPRASRTLDGMARCLVASDLHYPHHHEGAWEVFLSLIELIQPEEIVLDGDIFDFAQIGRYAKDPTKQRLLQDDIDACRRDILSRITLVGGKDTVYRFIVGNHEHSRWTHYLWDRCPELASLRCLSMEAVLGLAELGWYWQPYEHWVTDALIIYHGDRHTNTLGGGSAMSARKEMIDMGCSGITGHTHRAGAFFRQDRLGYRVWYEIGCLCDWRKMQAAGVTTRNTPTKPEDWHLACALVYYEPGKSEFHVDLIPILDNGRQTWAIYQGQRVTV